MSQSQVALRELISRPLVRAAGFLLRPLFSSPERESEVTMQTMCVPVYSACMGFPKEVYYRAYVILDLH